MTDTWKSFPDRRTSRQERHAAATKDSPLASADARLEALLALCGTTWEGILESISVHVSRHGCGNWRLACDLVDATRDALTDALLESATVPDDPTAYAIGICNNQRRHSPTTGLDRRRTCSLSADADELFADLRGGGLDDETPWDSPVRDIPADLSSFGLAAAQEIVVRSCADAKSWRVVAMRTGMTRRDTKNRFHGAVKKLRRNLQEIDPPPNKG